MKLRYQNLYGEEFRPPPSVGNTGNDEKLDSTFAGENYGIYQRNIEGIIEHSYYHLGQIVLTKKIIAN